jgi:hypothetical protein
MKPRIINFILISVLIILVSACTKADLKSDLYQDSPWESVQDEILLEDLMEDLFMEIEESNSWFDEIKAGREGNDCRILTVEPAERGVFPKTITIDYGRGCEVKEGFVKKGKIIVEISASPDSEEWTKTIRFARYSVNEKIFEGGKSITFNKEGRRGVPTWAIASRIKIKWDEESFVQQNMTRTRMQTAGFDTPLRPMDDQFIITGTTSGINRKGLGYNTTITEPLYMSKDCRWIKKGVIVFKVRGESESSLNYGEGDCDDLATFTKDGETKEIQLKGKGK